MPNDIAKLRRIMRNNKMIRDAFENVSPSTSLATAWRITPFLDATSNGMARFRYIKGDGTIRYAFGTRSPLLIPADKMPKGDHKPTGRQKKYIPYFDLDKHEWRSFYIFDYEDLDDKWTFNS